MATLVLGAAGAAAGASIGGTVLGLSSAVIGRAVGATLGRALDQRLMGSGSDVVDTGRIDRIRLTGAGEGAPVVQIHGRMRVSGQVIWATDFHETTHVTGGGKGAPSAPKTRSHSYSVSLAVALCEGEIARVGRVWADGGEIMRDQLNMRVYSGRGDQLPDPRIEAVEGAGNAPAYRGIAYVVLEDLDLGPFGNRVPQLSFEVLRPGQDIGPEARPDLTDAVRGVALVPGTGEYALATTPVHYSDGLGGNRSANVNSPSGKTDFLTSAEMLTEELPNARASALVISWFGDDLRAGRCSLRPKVEQADADGEGMPWTVSGLTRATASLVPKLDGRAVYGGTPTDQSVVEAIGHLNDAGQDVTFYPFVLMEQLEGNGLPDPWSDAADQPALPWRGRITLDHAPGQAGSADQTAAALAEVAAFFGTAQPGDFTVQPGSVTYAGAPEWSYRRFILHYAHLCAQAGGVSAFCIGSELRGLTHIRGPGDSFPAVDALIALAGDVRTILGAGPKIGYAADWSEYFGYHPQDGTGDVFFHLDPLWSDENIDFVGIDNYMPLSDWRAGQGHLDAGWGSIYSLDYLKANIAGGEGFDWFYHSQEARDAQIRTEITDGAHVEPWVFRVKDLKGWWSNMHHNRVDGLRDTSPTAWVPGSKPIWFTEYGCAAIDKGTNQPNKFLDPKSTESGLPHYSDGARDELMQMQYLRAFAEFYGEPENNPVSQDHGVQMVDMARAHVWAWDTRPFPAFPNNRDLWSDGGNYRTGHWLNGRTSARSLDSVVAEICDRSGVRDVDVSGLWGYVRGYSEDGAGDARSALQPLMLAYGFDALERDGMLLFRNRDGLEDAVIDPDRIAVLPGQGARVEAARAHSAEIAGRVRLSHVEADADYAIRAAEAIFPDEASRGVAQSELSLSLTPAEGRAVVERWLSEARIARDTIRFALPPSALCVGAGDVVALTLDDDSALYRVDSVDQAGAQIIEAVRVEPGVYAPSDAVEEAAPVASFTPALPVLPVFLDLPLLSETDTPHAPYVAASAVPWPGSVAIYSSTDDSGYGLNTLLSSAATVGVTQTPLLRAAPGLKDHGPPLRVRLARAGLSSASWSAVLNGANLAAIGDGSSDNWELFQFETATLIGESVFDLGGRLRGQLGSDALMPDVWPTGSRFVLLDSIPAQIELPEAARDLARHYRIGPAARASDDASYVHRVEAFRGMGLRPYSPVHLRAARDAAGALHLSWIRRTRSDGDSWSSFEVPLAEANERYLVRVMQGETILRETLSGGAAWDYTTSEQAGDGVAPPFRVRVAQVSDRFGPGLFADLVIDS